MRDKDTSDTTRVAAARGGTPAIVHLRIDPEAMPPATPSRQRAQACATIDGQAGQVSPQDRDRGRLARQ